MTWSLAVVPTGTSNIASVLAAFRRLGADPREVWEPAQVEACDRLVLPGVGSFGAAMTQLERSGMDEAVERRVDEGRPTLAICVGMQILATTSEESAGVAGLGQIDDEVRRFPGTVRVPQLGWNEVVSGPGCRFVSDGWAYFANSYRVDSVPEGWSAAYSDHGGRFVAALERGEVLACQFHPELSGQWGSGILGRWLTGEGRAA